MWSRFRARVQKRAGPTRKKSENRVGPTWRKSENRDCRERVKKAIISLTDRALSTNSKRS